MARDALTGAWLGSVAVVSFGVFSFTRIDSVWLVVAAALLGLLTAAVTH
jgi:hypothetical protein